MAGQRGAREETQTQYTPLQAGWAGDSRRGPQHSWAAAAAANGKHWAGTAQLDNCLKMPMSLTQLAEFILAADLFRAEKLKEAKLRLGKCPL